MNSRPKFFNAVLQCLQHSIRIGLFVSLLLMGIVMILGSLVQAQVVSDSENRDVQFARHPAEMKHASPGRNTQWPTAGKTLASHRLSVPRPGFSRSGGTRRYLVIAKYKIAKSQV